MAGSLRYQRTLEKRYDAVRAAAGRIADTLTNNLGGITTIKAFNAEAREVERVAVDSRAYGDANGEAIRYSAAFIPLIRMAILAGFTMTLLVGGREVLNGDLDVGLYSSLVYMTQRLLWPLTRLGETLDLYQRAMASCRRIFGLLEVEPVDPTRHAASSPSPSAARCASRACGSATATPRTATCSTASTSTSRPARPTPSSARPAPARARS